VDPEVRRLFTREYLFSDGWYAARLKARQEVEINYWRQRANYLDRFLKNASHADEAARLGIAARLELATKELREVESPTRLEKLAGTLGAEPINSHHEVRRPG
jgi:hypothetical protein